MKMRASGVRAAKMCAVNRPMRMRDEASEVPLPAPRAAYEVCACDAKRCCARKDDDVEAFERVRGLGRRNAKIPGADIRTVPRYTIMFMPRSMFILPDIRSPRSMPDAARCFTIRAILY